jgi:hypothetical protein
MKKSLVAAHISLWRGQAEMAHEFDICISRFCRNAISKEIQRRKKNGQKISIEDLRPAAGVADT